MLVVAEDPAASATEDEGSLIVNAGDGAAWVTVNVKPAMVIVPVRGEVVVLAATE